MLFYAPARLFAARFAADIFAIAHLIFAFHDTDVEFLASFADCRHFDAITIFAAVFDILIFFRYLR